MNTGLQGVTSLSRISGTERFVSKEVSVDTGVFEEEHDDELLWISTLHMGLVSVLYILEG